MKVAHGKPPNHARVLVRVAHGRDWHPATAHVRADGIRWRFDHAGWLDAHHTDEWKPAKRHMSGAT